MAHDFAPERRRRDDALHGRVAEHVDEVREVPRVGAVRGPGEAVVAAGEDADAAAVHLAHGARGRLDFPLQAFLHGHGGREAVGRRFPRAAGVGEVDGRGDEDAVFDRFEHGDGFGVGEAGVVDDVHARFGA